MQEKGVDYHETYSSVLKRSMLRTLITLAQLKNLDVHTADNTSAFFQLEEPNYIQVPQGMRLVKVKLGLQQRRLLKEHHKKKENCMMKGKCCIYGLKESYRHYLELNII
ncbi:hypothetical protein Zmor_011959 [Zophobas morio]|jgi:hypothetical protein|uniref:Reverse transcriptase Ty1/copia-type domain-containing protein n=1 Tax=Zophobas morio TaxID=2755281 RepID=A0AA38HJF3_9CUCU|nr:hypothetical protein Zmor_011959 [Zophobas morio]